MAAAPARIFVAAKAAAIALVVWAVYAPSFRGGWIWDDRVEIARNDLIHSPDGWAKVWRLANKGPDYYPLKSDAEWVEWHLWGDRTFGYHVVNVGLHLLSCLLLWRLLAGWGVRRAWLGGLLFAAHPLAVESVAFLSEIKNALSLPFLLLAMIAYVDWENVAGVADPGCRPQRGRLQGDSGRRPPFLRPFYALSLLCFLAAMLCKTSVVMFPFILLLYAWWRRGRVGLGDWLASAPFFALSSILGLVTVWYQVRRAIAGANLHAGLLSRVAHSGAAAMFYACKTLVPAALQPIYPRWSLAPQAWVMGLPWLAVGAVLCWLWTRRGAHGRGVLFGCGCFLINLAPVLGFIPMYYVRIAWTADHLAYLSLACAAGMAAFGFDRLSRFDREGGRGRRPRPPASERLAPVIPAGAIAACLFLAAGARAGAARFGDELDFWTYATNRNPDSWVCHDNFGMVYLVRGRIAEAVAEEEEAVRLYPDDALSRNDLGASLMRAGRYREAIAEFQTAIRLKPDLPSVHSNLGSALQDSGRIVEAIAEYTTALRLSPGFAEAHYGLGNAWVKAGLRERAVSEFDAALRIDPGMAEAHCNLGAALDALGRTKESIAEFEEGLSLNPDLYNAQYDLANTLVAAGRAADAIAHFEAALRLKPDFAAAQNNLGTALCGLGRIREGAEHIEAALRIDPGYEAARKNLEIIREQGH